MRKVEGREEKRVEKPKDVAALLFPFNGGELLARGNIDISEIPWILKQIENIFSCLKTYPRTRRFPVGSNCTLYIHEAIEPEFVLNTLRASLDAYWKCNAQEQIGIDVTVLCAKMA